MGADSGEDFEARVDKYCNNEDRRNNHRAPINASLGRRISSQAVRLCEDLLISVIPLNLNPKD